MPSTQETLSKLNYGWDLGETEWKTGMDDNLLLLGANLFLQVISIAETAPPGSPVDGDRYIPAATATGAWVGLENKVVRWHSATSSWLSYTAVDGWRARDENTGQIYIMDGSAWVLETSLYSNYANDSAAATGGVPIGGVYVNSSTYAITIRQS